MGEYICVITTELASISDNFIDSVTFFNTFDEAVEHGKAVVQSLHEYPAAADFFVYKFVASYSC